MAVRLRLTRVGGKKDPLWRVVVADQRSPRDGRVIETIGHYNAQTEPSTIVLDEERARSWLARGAQPSGTVRKLLHIRGIETDAVVLDADHQLVVPFDGDQATFGLGVTDDVRHRLDRHPVGGELDR